MIYVVKVDRRKPNYTVYIGRAWAGLPESKWNNPFHLYNYANDRALVLKLYEEHVRSKPELMAALPELIDQVLGCWCYPEACHGDVLVKLVKEITQPAIGDLAQAVNMHGDFMLPEPLRVTEIYEALGERWAQLEGQLGAVRYEQVVWP